MAFNQSPEHAINARPQAKDTVLGSISEGMAWTAHSAQDAWTNVTLKASLPEFKGVEPGVDKGGLDFAKADAALAGGGLYASNIAKPDAARQKGIAAADQKLDDWLMAA